MTLRDRYEDAAERWRWYWTPRKLANALAALVLAFILHLVTGCASHGPIQIPLVGTDLCSVVPDYCAEACAEHDLDYRWPLDADGDGDRDECDRRIYDWKLARACGAWGILVYPGVRLFGYGSFQHRTEK